MSRRGLVCLALATLLPWLVACGGDDELAGDLPTSTTSAAAAPAPPAKGLDLSDGRAQVEVASGDSQALPGSDGGVRITIGAIDHGKAYVTLARADGELWIKLRPMKAGDQAEFACDGSDYTLTLRELRAEAGHQTACFDVAPAAGS